MSLVELSDRSVGPGDWFTRMSGLRSDIVKSLSSSSYSFQPGSVEESFPTSTESADLLLSPYLPEITTCVPVNISGTPSLLSEPG
jgi:hypothetical protein